MAVEAEDDRASFGPHAQVVPALERYFVLQARVRALGGDQFL